MSKRLITELSDEQKGMLSHYREKWKAIATLTQPIDREKVEVAIRAAYKVGDYPEPEIVFFCNPFAAIKDILATENFKTYLGRNIRYKFGKRVMDHLRHLIERQLDNTLFYNLMNQIEYPGFPHHLDRNNLPQASHFPRGIESCIETQILKDFDRTKTNDLELEHSDLSDLLEALTRPAEWSFWGCLFDFCISVLGLQHDRKKWQAVQELMQCCGLIFQFEKVCIVCDRPYKLSFDRQNFLHAEGKYALEFVDGYGVYAYHGGERPEGRRCKNDEYIEPGTKVKLPITGEYGIVIHCWYSHEIFDFDCYVAFFGTSFPDNETDCRPYIFRYAAVSLEILE